MAHASRLDDLHHRDESRFPALPQSWRRRSIDPPSVPGTT
jgi:hypothetical protein